MGLIRTSVAGVTRPDYISASLHLGIHRSDFNWAVSAQQNRRRATTGRIRRTTTDPPPKPSVQFQRYFDQQRLLFLLNPIFDSQADSPPLAGGGNSFPWPGQNRGRTLMRAYGPIRTNPAGGVNPDKSRESDMPSMSHNGAEHHTMLQTSHIHSYHTRDLIQSMWLEHVLLDQGREVGRWRG